MTIAALFLGTLFSAPPAAADEPTTAVVCALVGMPSAAGATVATDLTTATTDANGDARLTCILGPATTITVAGTTAAGTAQTYIPSVRSDVACNDGSSAAPETRSVNFW